MADRVLCNYLIRGPEEVGTEDRVAAPVIDIERTNEAQAQDEVTSSSTYAYDPLDRRIMVAHGGADITWTRWDGDDVVSDFGPNGSTAYMTRAGTDICWGRFDSLIGGERRGVDRNGKVLRSAKGFLRWRACKAQISSSSAPCHFYGLGVDLERRGVGAAEGDTLK